MRLNLLWAAALLSRGALCAGTDDQIGADINYGTFQSPSAHVRPRFRYWVNDAALNLTVVAEDVKAAGQAGAGGFELLGYYLYGDTKVFNLDAPLQTDWTVYGFGSTAWEDLVETVLTTSKQENLVVDLALGPNQGAGVPAEYNDDGLLWDIAAFNVSVPIGENFANTLPGWGTGTLVAAVGGLVQSSGNTTIVLEESSLVDFTASVNSTGYLHAQFPECADGLEYIVFSYYLVHSRARETPDPLAVDAAVPQSPVDTYQQNGTWVVDHFSAKGAQTAIGFWNQSLLNNRTRPLIGKAGNFLWEDSQEFMASLFWTPSLQNAFKSNRGYSVNKYIPLLFSGSPAYVTDESDGGESHVVDYQQTLTELNAEYLNTLRQWSESLGVQFSAQVVYNLPMDMLANIPHVNGPECETFGFGNNIDSYRQFSGPAHLAGKRVISSEAGADPGRAYQQTIPELLWTLKRSLAGSVNQFVLHGFPYSGNYPNTTWPGFTAFGYVFSEMHGPRQPAFAFYSDFMDYIARNQYVAQTGMPKVDLAFWSKSTSYKTVPTRYSPADLLDAGYTYEYLSPDNLDLPEAYVSDRTLAPKRQAFKALVIRANESLTLAGVNRLIRFAQSGLPIIFSGGLPSNFSGYNPDGTKQAVASVKRLSSLKNVHIVPYDKLAASVRSLGILPRTAVVTNGTWYTYWRQDTQSSTEFVYVYSDSPGVLPGQGYTSGTISFETTGQPILYDAWSGEVHPISIYNQSSTHTTIPLGLAGNQTAIIGFRHNAAAAHLHAVETATGVLWANGTKDSVTIYRSFDTGSRAVALSNGSSVTLQPMRGRPFALSNWTLVVESWTPPSDLYDIEAGSDYTNSTFQVPTLAPWSQISESLTNVSGRGYYSTSFDWPPKSSACTRISGAVIDLGPVAHTARVTVNGQTLPPLDVTWARRDIGPLLVHGKNTVGIVVATPLGNGLRGPYDKLETSGKLATADVASAPAVAEYGLLSPVQIIPYRTDVF